MAHPIQVLKAAWRVVRQAHREKATGMLEFGLKEMQNLLSLMMLGSLVGLPSPPPAIAFELIPPLEDDIRTMTARADEIRAIRPGLDGMEIDLAAWVRRCLESSREEIERTCRYHAVMNLGACLGIMKYSPGTEEYAVLRAIEHIGEKHAGSYDLIVFDTPPTALTLRFLAMPAISALWIEQLSKMPKAILEKRQTVLKLNPEASALGGAVKQEDAPSTASSVP